ncbi:hypothetical protein M4I32_01270 [Microbacterium sp. LRZ72]|uniref:hypothetical protein n=1 Tax=Microbacterium sp. LRZ72 TaxID=2942481 RepID=UPI0029B15D0C|nr:hypothetical protein [Microbacterium sp. LRZ72]MDX2375431.1 hypothetical protein [Microbacterium sp. LRZ72]
MALNDRHRDRMDLDDAARETNELLIRPITDELQALRADREITAADLHEVLASVGLPGARVRDDGPRILFGVSGPEGGCLYGDITSGVISIEVGGYILDGGCLPAQ